jgi:hypothetical protein
MDTIDRSTLEGKLLPELQQIAQTMGIEGSQRLRKAGLIDAIVEASSNGERPGNGEARTSSSRERAVATEAVEIGAVTTAADDTGARRPKRRPTSVGPKRVVVRAARIVALMTAKVVPATHVPRAVTAATEATGTTLATAGAGQPARSGGSSAKTAANARSRNVSKR